MTRAVAGNLLARGIRVNPVAPGPVWTPLNPSDKEAPKVGEFGSQAKHGTPGTAGGDCPAYVFLASRQCSSYTPASGFDDLLPWTWRPASARLEA